MAAVTLIVFVSAPLGAAAFGAYGVIFLAIPLGIGVRRTGSTSGDGGKGMPASAIFDRLGGLVVALARRRAIVLPLAGLVTIGCAYLASRLETRFDIRDFFAPDTDFVVGLERFDRYVGERGGEPASVYIEGRLEDPSSLEAMEAFQEEVRALETDRLARDSEGRIIIEGPRGDASTASITVRLPGSRALENVREAREALAPLVSRLEGRLGEVDPEARAILTGGPIVRLAGIEAIAKAFRRSLPVAVLLCLVIATVFMRSFRYAVVSCIPILIVVVWLHAFMHVAGYSLNVVTATLGAISIGIGIDFSIHFTLRYREESRRRGSWSEAMAVAGAGTGGALLGSAASSIVGFSILAFAPMPLFASYGLLTAVMIALAGGVTLFVLPSLLTLLDPGGGDHRDG
jgi:predicted RND superfamily exporter protein